MKKQSLAHFKGETGWAFAILNGRLGEIIFTIGKGVDGIQGHCYVKREEYTTKREQEMIDTDTKKHRLSYKKGKYRQV